MSSLLLVEDAAALAELFGDVLRSRQGHDVQVCFAVEDVELMLDGRRYDLAIVDLSFPQERATGLDALVEIHTAQPTTKLAIMTQGDGWVGDLLRDAWDLLPISSIISKTAPLDYQLDMITEVLAGGPVTVDPAIQPLIPAHRNPLRTPERFGRLIQHQGHAKLWNALLQRDLDATYKHVADATGLKLNTVKNYRSQLLGELSVHGLDDPSLREMREFAWRCRAFLRPHVTDALGSSAA
jgi:DNA-binding NarL/FixJ family response regulator